MEKPAPGSLLLTNGTVHTLDPHRPLAQAVLLLGNRIWAVGSPDDVRAQAPADATELDLGGRTVLPAFTDAHIHLVEFAASLQTVSLVGARSKEEALARVAQAAQMRPPGQWITGQGWDRNSWPDPRFPTRADLDRVAPDHPVALDSKDMHSLWANSLALRLADVSAKTVDPPGGGIERDSDRHPTGILKEKPAKDLVRRVVQKAGPEQLTQALEQSFRLFWQRGVTAVHSMEDATAFRLLQEMRRSGRLGLRVYQSLTEQSLEGAIRAGIQTGFGDERLRVGGVKIFMDGALGSRTAEMLEPYLVEPDNLGIPVTTDEDLWSLLDLASRHGVPAVIHAIGDRANRRALDALERVRAAEVQRGVPRHALRHRIEHAQIVTPEDQPRFAQLDVIASIQPVHATSDMEMAEQYWGAERCRYAYPMGSLLRSGARLALGSDCPVEALNPLAGIHAAATRRRPDGAPGPQGWNPQERLTVQQAVEGFTLGGAFAAGEEHLRGSLTPGKLADLVVLSADIFHIDPTEIVHTEVVATLFDGEVVFGQEALGG
ncbi:MAG: amidohydrolase [Chloroflexi bacterium]|nr:amidohydrolase [Chloroflexota bacterium]